MYFIKPERARESPYLVHRTSGGFGVLKPNPSYSAAEAQREDLEDSELNPGYRRPVATLAPTQKGPNQ